MAQESVNVRTPDYEKRASAEGPFTTVSNVTTILKSVPVAEDQVVLIVGTIAVYTSDFSNVARYGFAASAVRQALGDVTAPAFKYDEVGGYVGNRPRFTLNANTGTQEAELIAEGRNGETLTYVLDSTVFFLPPA